MAGWITRVVSLPPPTPPTPPQTPFRDMLGACATPERRVCYTPGQPPRGAPRFTDSACLRRLGPTPPLRGGGRQIGLQKAFHRPVTRPGPRFWRSSLPTHSRPDPNHPITLPKPSPNPIQTIGKNGKNRFLHRGDHGQIGPRRPSAGLSHGQDRDLGNQASLHTQYPTQITP